jgi:hypothetical protein
VVEDSQAPQGSTRRKALTGSFVALWAFFDALVGLIIVAAAAWLNALIVAVVAAVVLSIINIFCCTWLNREWAAWAAGSGKRVEARIQKLRSSSRARKPVAWVTDGAVGWYVAAACLTNAVQATALARVIGGQPVAERKVRIGAIGFSIFVAVLFSLIGLGLRDIL